MKLTNEEDAINQAATAGYPNVPGFPTYADEAEVLQDRAFWQALTKVRGWKEGEYAQCGSSDCVHNDEYLPSWLYHALRYFETRLSNGDTKAYWESLP